MTDWAATTSELATGAGTLVLAIATFAAVRSANRTARTAEASMQAGMRPVLMHTRLTDTEQKIAFGDGKWVLVAGGGAAVEASAAAVYLAISVRNAGTGMAILHGWRVRPGRQDNTIRPPLADFTPQSRDMYVASADIGFWQGALRDPADPLFAPMTAAVRAEEILMLDLLYGNFEGGQRVISRFSLQTRDGPGQAGDLGPALSASQAAGGASQAGRLAAGSLPAGRLGETGPEPEDGRGDEPERHPQGRWLSSVVRHWNVDRPDPR